MIKKNLSIKVGIDINKMETEKVISNSTLVGEKCYDDNIRLSRTNP